MNELAERKNKMHAYLIPASIIVAGGLIAGAVFFSFNTQTQNTSSFGNNLSPTAENIQPVTESDHIRGSKDAKVTIVEYSDYECPFCKRIHPTLKQIVEEFAGEVRWVYRHFPLTSIHSRAFAASVASECTARLGGNDAFWVFTDEVFSNQQKLGSSLYEEIVSDLGLSVGTFRSCIGNNEIAESVEKDYQNAIDSGGRGTPFVVVINEKGETFPFSGALPYQQVRSIIESALES